MAFWNGHQSFPFGNLSASAGDQEAFQEAWRNFMRSNQGAWAGPSGPFAGWGNHPHRGHRQQNQSGRDGSRADASTRDQPQPGPPTGENEKADDDISDDETIKTPTTEAEKAADDAPRTGERTTSDGPRRHRGGCGRGRRGPAFGCRGWRGFPAGNVNVADLGAFLNDMATSFADPAGPRDGGAASQEFTPDADIFDTESAFLVHLSLPGARKEDVGVNWDPEADELIVAGVVHRPGVDEELLATLARGERKVGVFERKVRLGSRANPAQVDVDGIAAKLEDGVLRVEVPKLDRDYVEIKKVDVQ